MKVKRFLSLLMVGLMAVSFLAGCTAKKQESTMANGSQVQSTKTEDVVDIEVWSTNIGFLPVEKGSPMYNFYKEKIGVGIIQPYVEWNGGSNYQQQLNLKIASGEMPDMFLPVNGMESELAKNGAILDLTELLPAKAPKLWNQIPQDVWNITKSYDPNGKGRIYSTPTVMDYTLMTGMIRQDWLDKLGLSMPKTQDEFVKVLEAFRDKDPNGNGQKDEIPTGGRQQAKWMDHLFGMYGLAMWEGEPQWDIYDGKLTYAAVTPNMKDALAFIRTLYAQKLLDPETLLNDKAKWEGKITSNRVGVHYHWASDSTEKSETMLKTTGVKGNFVNLPAIDAPGYKSFYTQKKTKFPAWVVKAQKDQKKVDACLKVLNAYGDKSLFRTFANGVEGMHHQVVNGSIRMLPDDKTKMQNRIIVPGEQIVTLDYILNDLKATIAADPSREWSISQSIRNFEGLQKYGKSIAGDGMPASVYANYPDIQNRTLYVEYASKIILGEYPISKFDEFVDRWNKSGGEAVTKAAREWYDKIKK